MRLQNAIILVLAAATLGTPRAGAQISDDVVRIGVLNDQSGLYADLGGQGSVVAARMAVEDAGGSVLGKLVEIIFADHQNKADIGMAVSRRWFEAAAVDMAIGFDGGKLTIETGNPFLDDVYAGQHGDVEPGQYVMVAISDNGTGMPPDVAARVFDPFFTTKPSGKGTGLGLSQVFGFIKQSHGHIKIYSEVGCGTTVKLYLPRNDQIATAMPMTLPPVPAAGAGEWSW